MRLNDIDINRSIATYFGHKTEEGGDTLFVGIKREGENVVSIQGVVDYCNNYANAGNIIDILIKDGYTVELDKDGVSVGTYYVGKACEGNALRGVALAFMYLYNVPIIKGPYQPEPLLG